MNIVVFGATGATGRLVVQSALAAGHAVTAFVRETSRMSVAHPALRIVEGDAMDSASVASAVQGMDAVVCTLGTMPEAKADRGRRQPDVPVCSVGTRNIIASLHRPDLRLIVESSVCVGSSYDTGRFGAGVVVRLALKRVMADKEEQEAAVKDSACNWTILRPVKLTNKPAMGNLKAGVDLPWYLTSKATRADVANYMVQILGDAATFKKAMTLRN